MLKTKHLNRWLWRWHIIAGLLTLPIVLLLCLTGIAYLFKEDYNHAIYKKIVFVDPPVNTKNNKSETTSRLNYQSQLNVILNSGGHHVMQVLLPETEHDATGFRLHSHGHSRDIIYLNPYSGEITGQINQKETLMYKIRKLHGELLLSKPGTYLVELVASWFIVLIITGLYIWWPSKVFSLSGFFTIRVSKGRKAFWRDVHAVFGFWLSLFMLVILAGGMPWTDIFGAQLKWVQEKTNTGYPQHWRSSKGLQSMPPVHHHSTETLSIDKLVTIAENHNLEGKITIKIPMTPEGVFTITNRAFWLSDQKVLHIDQYSGDIVKMYDWSDVGILMDLRQIAMRFHQGQYGLLNWWIVLLLTSLFTLSTIAGLCSYLIRKPKGRWGFPKVPDSFHVGKWVFTGILLLGVLFPLFGASLVLLFLYQWFYEKKQAFVFNT